MSGGLACVSVEPGRLVPGRVGRERTGGAPFARGWAGDSEDSMFDAAEGTLNFKWRSFSFLFFSPSPRLSHYCPSQHPRSIQNNLYSSVPTAMVVTHQGQPLLYISVCSRHPPSPLFFSLSIHLSPLSSLFLPSSSSSSPSLSPLLPPLSLSLPLSSSLSFSLSPFSLSLSPPLFSSSYPSPSISLPSPSPSPPLSSPLVCLSPSLSPWSHSLLEGACEMTGGLIEGLHSPIRILPFSDTTLAPRPTSTKAGQVSTEVFFGGREGCGEREGGGCKAEQTIEFKRQQRHRKKNNQREKKPALRRCRRL